MMLARRKALTRIGAVVGGVLLARSLTAHKAYAQGQTVLSKEVAEVPLEPEAAQWQQAGAIEIPLSPQVLVKPRIYETSVSSVSVRSLYDAKSVGFLLEWGDKGENRGLGRIASYRDAVALQFPAEPARSTPHFAMGEPNNSVIIYHWKADWQFGPEYDVNEEFPGMHWDFYPHSGKGPGQIPEAADYGGPGSPAYVADKSYIPAWWVGNPLADIELKRRTPVEKLTATGFSSLTSAKEQDGMGKAVRTGNGWKVAIAIPRAQGQLGFASGQVVPINFAVWDGANNERGGEKSVSSWNWLALEKKTGASVFIIPVAIALAAGALEWVIVRRLRRQTAAKP